MGRIPPRLRLLVALAVFALAVSGFAAERVRESALAGAWYPADPGRLQEQVDGFLAAAQTPAPQGRIRALIAPHAGYAYSGPTAGAGFALVKGQDFKRVLILAPSHQSGFRGLAIAEADAWRTPLGDIPVDLEAIESLRASPLVSAQPAAQAPEHSIEIMLPLLQGALGPGWRLVPVLVGDLRAEDYEAAADLLLPLADDGTLVVVSSDFTHYGPHFDYRPFPLDAQTRERIRALDQGAISRILAKDAEGFLAYQQETGITICGYRPIGVMLRMLGANSGPGAKVQPVAYATSGSLTGDYGNSVSYAVLVVTDPHPRSDRSGPTPQPPTPATVPVPGQAPASARATQTGTALAEDDLKVLHRLASLALEEAVLGPSDDRKEAVRQAVEALPKRLLEPAGVFVTLKRRGALRGCIGYIEPREPLYRAVLENGVNAARHDPRFSPVQASEFKDLELEISVLTPPRPLASWEEFRVGKEGIILSKGGRRAAFLPEVAVEQGWSRDETLSYLARKAGLAAGDWREGASFAVFTSIKYSAPYGTP